ncbi:MAG: hypothetical protein MJ145_03010 [Clostridia bacterium]|nr:hypothetical protein [Clostridia bacterium]
MDAIAVYKKLTKKTKIVLMYVKNIIFAPNKMNHNPFSKVRANLSGGYTADQWKLFHMNSRKRKEYLSEFDWYKSRYINEPFDYMLNNKVVATEVLKDYMHCPEIYIIKDKGKILDFGDGSQIDYDTCLEIIKSIGEVIIKPHRKGKGNGVNIIKWEDGSFIFDDKKVGIEVIVDRLEKDNWYISQVIHQHAYAAGLYDKTVNTIRIITLRNPNTKEIEVFFAVQRTGRKETIPVDNASKGGVVCKIDLETGKLSEGRRIDSLDVYETHPDSGNQLTGVQVPNWDILKGEVLAAHKKLPYMELIAWDVIVNEEGIHYICEANTSSGINILQLWGGQKQSAMGDLFRAHGVIK